MEEFRKLGIIEPIIKSITDEGFTEPSEIQAKSIPFVIQGKDVIAESATGSGKTLAFGSGIIQNCERGKGIQALVLTPTRELAEQISRKMRNFSKYKPLNVTVVYGGVSINPQIKWLQNTDILIATPGRILDHMERRTVNLQNVKILVLDEADRMFEMGFIDDVEKIIRSCPQKRQTLLFSATISSEVYHIAKRYMSNPIRVLAETQVDPKKLTQFYYDVQDNMKFSLLVHLLKNEKSGLVMVFCNTRHNTDFVARNLSALGIDAMATHGGFSQDKRNNVLKKFHSESVYVLVCTDVASRGLDIQGVSHVYNYDIPKDSKQYIHRIGRTARAGNEGKAVSILSSRDHDNFSRVLRECDVNITKIPMPQIERAHIKILDKGRSFDRRPSGFRPRKFSGERRHTPRFRN